MLLMMNSDTSQEGNFLRPKWVLNGYMFVSLKMLMQTP